VDSAAEKDWWIVFFDLQQKSDEKIYFKNL